MKKLFLALTLCLTACTTPKQFSTGLYTQKSNSPDIILLQPDMKKDAELWLYEAKTRLSNPLIVMGHGNEWTVDKKHVWMQFNGSAAEWCPTQSLAEALHQLYPERQIVLIVCNPHAHDLQVDSVYYAKASVWCTPDSFENIFTPLDEKHETIKDSGLVGSIDEFYCKGKKLLNK